MKIVSINLGLTGSTGKIMRGIHDIAKAEGHEFLMMAPQCEKNTAENDVFYIGSRFFRRINAYLGIITGLDGCFSVFATIKALKRMREYKPDLIHLHNLHNTYINLPMLFRFIKKNDIPVVWTLHDCWSFTGHCPHFAFEKCDKWKTGCGNCPRYREYPKSLFDNSGFMWKFKRKWFTGVKNMTLVTPSKWLADLASQSYLGGYPVKTIHNGIDLNVFRYDPGDFKKKYGLKDKKIVLGVAFGWSTKKGLDVFEALSDSLPDDYRIVLVGTDEAIDQRLPEKIISIHRTNNQKELAEIYSDADVFVNPTREDTFPTVNIEALACGTPVVTFNTGGSGEIPDNTCGTVIAGEEIKRLKDEIIRVIKERPYNRDTCRARACNFDMKDMFKEYIKLYENCSYSTQCNV